MSITADDLESFLAQAPAASGVPPPELDRMLRILKEQRANTSTPRQPARPAAPPHR